MATPPESKRQKIEHRPKWCIEAILPDEYEKKIPLVKVYVSKLTDNKQLFVVMRELCDLLPLESLRHLKRVRNNEIIICPVKDFNEENQTLEKYLLDEKNLPSSVVEMLCKEVVRKNVPAIPPKLRWQYKLASYHWSCKFHPDKYMESLFDGSNFNAETKKFHIEMAKLLKALTKTIGDGIPFGICVDPRTWSIVAMAVSNTAKNPIMHAPQVLIDYVARTQGGGAWNHEHIEFQENKPVEEQDNVNARVTLAGIPADYLELLKKESQHFHELKFGAEIQRKKMTKWSNEPPEGDNNLEKYGPYLCTGYYMYFSHEPCLMCGMALLHSRVKRIFFVEVSSNGALVTRFKLHTVKEVNHHYEVFPILEKNDVE